MTEHTALPWTVRISDHYLDVIQDNDRGEFIFQNKYPNTKSKANAHLIVKSVKYHDQLVGEMKALVNEVGVCWEINDQLLREIIFGGNTNYTIVLDQIERARALLTKIKQETAHEYG